MRKVFLKCINFFMDLFTNILRYFLNLSRFSVKLIMKIMKFSSVIWPEIRIQWVYCYRYTQKKNTDFKACSRATRSSKSSRSRTDRSSPSGTNPRDWRRSAARLGSWRSTRSCSRLGLPKSKWSARVIGNWWHIYRWKSLEEANAEPVATRVMARREVTVWSLTMLITITIK